MTQDLQSSKLEPRWPIVLTGVVVYASTQLPGRVRVFPHWVVVLLAVSLIVPMVALHLARAKQRWLQLEKIAIALFLAVSVFGIVLDLKDLFHAMLQPPAGLTGIELLNSSISLWASNVLMFSVAYWWIDRGGAESRVSGLQQMPDWHFPREDVDDGNVPPWQPTYVDYLFLAFCTATSFGPTEAMPMTARAKLLMMAESLISLVTVLAIASRAIGLLGN
ncbi:MAG: hypothetical protein WBS19_08640 [Candidatus Korobacteraceae bacterium]